MANHEEDDLLTFFANSEPETHEFNEEAKLFAEKYQAYLEQHDQEVHNGERCEEERASMLAFLAHRWGFSPRTAKLFTQSLELYAQHHVGRPDPEAKCYAWYMDPDPFNRIVVFEWWPRNGQEINVDTYGDLYFKKRDTPNDIWSPGARVASDIKWRTAKQVAEGQGFTVEVAETS